MQATADISWQSTKHNGWVQMRERLIIITREALYLGASRILQCCVRSLGSRRNQPVDPILKCFKDPILVQFPNFFFEMGIQFGF
jgi:hypothetical protein